MRSLIETEWFTVPCDVCGAESSSLDLLDAWASRIIQKQNDYIWHHEDVQCTQCGFVFNRLRPAAGFLRNYYTDCWPIASTSVAIDLDFDVSSRLELLKTWLDPNAQVYEIGDKLGEFHAALVAAGYKVVGDDVMAEGNERGEWLDGLFRIGTVATPPAIMRNAFDAVLAYFVVEHLANAPDWLRSMRGILSPDGFLIIEVPHLLKHPKEALMHEHFLYLTPDSLTALVQKAGFKVIETRETGASRIFGFSLIARRLEVLPVSGPSAYTESTTRSLSICSADLQAAYKRGRQMLSQAHDNLVISAGLVACAIDGAAGPSRVCVFGANQTASEIARFLGDLLVGNAVQVLAFDNSDVKTGTLLEGFRSPVQKPNAADFDSSVLHVCVICSRGWTDAIAEQIRSFGLLSFTLVNGAAGRLLPND